MTLFAGSMAHVCAAGLALAAGYGAAAMAGTIRGQTTPGGGSMATLAAVDDVEGYISAVSAETAPAPLPRHVVATRGPLGGALADFSASDDLINLVWAPLPAVPRPLSARDRRRARPETVVPVLRTALVMPDLPALPMPDMGSGGDAPSMPRLTADLERLGVRGFAAQMLEERPLVPRKPRSEPAHLAMSRTPSLGHAYSRAGDPLAALPFSEGEVGPAPEFIMPFANGRVTSLFNQGRVHPAIDLAGKLGSPVLITTVAQKVTFAGWRGGYGNAVITVDDFGRTHLYGHLQRITTRVGVRLSQGDQVGHLGSTGHSTGPHVHYEVRNPKGVHINPVTLLFPGRGISKGYAWTDVRQESVLARLAARSR
jgi:hypothetical protein